jgi:hypothetical protein
MKLSTQKFSKQILATLLIYPLTLALMGCSVDTVLSDIDLALQTAASLETAIGAVSPADSAALQLLTGIATAGLNAIQKDYDTYEASKSAGDLQKVEAAANALQVNLPQELAAAHITSTTAVTKATAWVNLVVLATNAVLNEVGAVSAVSAHTVTTIPTPEALQAKWQSEVCSGDTACGNLVKVHKKHAPRKL